MNTLTQRERSLIALAIAIGLIAAAWLVVVSPILNGFAHRREQRADALATLSRNTRLIGAFGRLRAEAVGLRREAEIYALPAATPTVAAEAARGRVAKAVAAEGGALQALRTQSAPKNRVRLQADLRMSLAQLTRLIARLETERPFATVDGLTVAAVEGEGVGASAPLEARLEVTYAVR